MQEFDRDFEPSSDSPVVYHLYGHVNHPESMVVTESNYIDFLVNISREPNIIPPRIMRALSGDSILLMGYNLKDWHFTVLFHGVLSGYLRNSLSGSHYVVQPQPQPEDSSSTQHERLLRYLERYFSKENFQVYWGDAREFLSELRPRLEA